MFFSKSTFKNIAIKNENDQPIPKFHNFSVITLEG